MKKKIFIILFVFGSWFWWEKPMEQFRGPRCLANEDEFFSGQRRWCRLRQRGRWRTTRCSRGTFRAWQRPPKPRSTNGFAAREPAECQPKITHSHTASYRRASTATTGAGFPSLWTSCCGAAGLWLLREDSSLSAASILRKRMENGWLEMADIGTRDGSFHEGGLASIDLIANEYIHFRKVF